MLNIPQLDQSLDLGRLVQHINHQSKMTSYVLQSNTVEKAHWGNPMNKSNTVAFNFPHMILVLWLRAITIFPKVTNFFL